MHTLSENTISVTLKNVSVSTVDLYSLSKYRRLEGQQIKKING